MRNCKLLREYVLYIEKVRYYACSIPIEQAVPCAVDDCIATVILAEGISQGISQAHLVNLQSLMKNLHMTATGAMEASEICPEERTQYMEQL